MNRELEYDRDDMDAAKEEGHEEGYEEGYEAAKEKFSIKEDFGPNSFRYLLEAINELETFLRGQDNL